MDTDTATKIVLIDDDDDYVVWTQNTQNTLFARICRSGWEGEVCHRDMRFKWLVLFAIWCLSELSIGLCCTCAVEKKRDIETRATTRRLWERVFLLSYLCIATNYHIRTCQDMFVFERPVC